MAEVKNKHYKQQSKLDWYTDGDISREHLDLGCQMRIADAAEKSTFALERIASNIGHQSSARIFAERKVKRLENKVKKLQAQLETAYAKN